MTSTIGPRGDRIGDDDAIDLLPYFVALRRHWLAIAGVTLAAGLVTFVVSLWWPATYEAHAQVLANPPKLGEIDPRNTGLTVQTFREILQNQLLASQVVDAMGLRKAPYSLTPSGFLADHVKVENPRDTAVLDVAVRLGDAQLAAAVVNRYVEQGVALATRVSEDSARSLEQMLKTQVDEARKRFDAVETQLVARKKGSQVELVKEDVNALLGERGELVRLTVEIEGEKARLAKATEELGRQERLRSTPTAVSVAAALDQAVREGDAAEERLARERARERESRATESQPQPAREADRQATRPWDGRTTESDRPPGDIRTRDTAGRKDERRLPAPSTRQDNGPAARAAERPAEVVHPLPLRDEAVSPFVNPVYEILNQQVATSRARLASLESRRAALAGTLKVSGAEIAQLSELYKRETEVARLETEYELARDVYVEVSSRYAQATAQALSRSAALQVLDRALPPDRPISPRPVRAAAVALLLALIASSIWVLAIPFNSSLGGYR